MQNNLQQLDLFGFPIQTPAQSKKKEKAVKETTVQEVTLAPEEKTTVADAVAIEEIAIAPVIEPAI
ncbi:MAG: hypothetical protein ABIS69_00330, partial [Sediminibacterium sp.]